MFKLQHQFNNIVETAQLTNEWSDARCSKCPPPTSSSNTSLQSLTFI